MDQKAYDQFVNSLFRESFDERRIKKKGKFFLYPKSDYVLKGLLFDKVRNGLYIHWFVMPLIPEKRVISLTFGERIQNNAGRNLFLLDSNRLSSTENELTQLVPAVFPLLDSINSIQEFYDFFYQEKRVTSLSQSWLNSELRLLQTKLFCQAFLRLDFNSTIDKINNFTQNKETTLSSWEQEIIEQVELIKNQSTNNEMIDLLGSIRKQSIENLKIKKFVSH